MAEPWDRIEAETRGAFHGEGNFPLRAYSEYMPSPYVGIKPYAPERAHGAATFGCGDASALDIDEYEQSHDLEPGLDRIADHLVLELGRLQRGEPNTLSQALLHNNPAWPADLAQAARAGRLKHDPSIIIMPLALSRTQDDKGNDRWTLFGASHEGPARPVWRGLDEAGLQKILTWAGVDGDWKIFAAAGEVGEPLRARIVKDTPIDQVQVLVTFEPFSHLPAAIREAYLAGELQLVPSPASLVFFEHPLYRKLAKQLPHAMQIPLLHLFPRIEASCAIRIPQSGWLDENDEATAKHKAHVAKHGPHDHKIVSTVIRTHRWQRVARDADIHGDGAYTDKVSTALFATDPVTIDLYNKPLARNSQVWSETYELVLDGPRASKAQIRQAAELVDRGGRFGYRMYWPPMRAGVRELFWHVPVVAASGRGRMRDTITGYVTAELPGAQTLVLQPHFLARPEHVAAARLFERDPGHVRHTTCQNVRKLLEAKELLGGPIAPEHARSLLHIPKKDYLDDWFAWLATHASDKAKAAVLVTQLRACIAPEPAPAHTPIVIDQFGTREVEEQIWNSIAALAHGEFIQKSNGDGISVNKGKHGGKAAKAAHIHTHERRDLEALGDHLHERYNALIEANGMTGKAECVDHVFRWETDFDFPWMEGWAANLDKPAERNIVMIIPGKRRDQAVVMGDHYDTAYMEDVYYKESGGDLLRAPAAGADDNHSATNALLMCAEKLLPLAKAGKLERDVWLIHLTGEEYPADCMGARALCQGLVEKSLVFTAEDGSKRDVSHVDCVAAFVLDMVGHNTEKDRDVFQIAPGEGVGSAKLARRAHRANEAWNALAKQWNTTRKGLKRAQRVPDDPEHYRSPPPPPFACLPLHGEVRVEWEPRSALFNTDGQIFSDVGIPVVLFMENYDISRKGYHDTHDTMANIDLDYCTAITAIAIETVADVACAKQL